MGKWTRFMDMHSGGGSKLDWEYIYIKGDEPEATEIFMRKFGRNPDNVTCDCCGSDYSVRTHDDLESATQFERGEKTLEEYRKDPNVLFVEAA